MPDHAETTPIYREIQAIAENNRDALEAARRRERAMVDEAAAARCSAPEHYWQERHRLERRQYALDELAALFRELDQ